jgi:hypothetical protein
LGSSAAISCRIAAPIGTSSDAVRMAIDNRPNKVPTEN